MFEATLQWTQEKLSNLVSLPARIAGNDKANRYALFAAGTVFGLTLLSFTVGLLSLNLSLASAIVSMGITSAMAGGATFLAARLCQYIDAKMTPLIRLANDTNARLNELAPKMSEVLDEAQFLELKANATLDQAQRVAKHANAQLAKLDHTVAARQATTLLAQEHLPTLRANLTELNKSVGNLGPLSAEFKETLQIILDRVKRIQESAKKILCPAEDSDADSEESEGVTPEIEKLMHLIHDQRKSLKTNITKRRTPRVVKEADTRKVIRDTQRMLSALSATQESLDILATSIAPELKDVLPLLAQIQATVKEVQATTRTVRGAADSANQQGLVSWLWRGGDQKAMPDSPANSAAPAASRPKATV